VIALYEEIFENGSNDFKRDALTSAKIVDTLVKLGGESRFEH
jgi:hypothetical protein